MSPATLTFPVDEVAVDLLRMNEQVKHLPAGELQNTHVRIDIFHDIIFVLKL